MKEVNMTSKKVWIMVMILIFALGVGFSFSVAVEEVSAASCNCHTEQGCPPVCIRGGIWDPIEEVCEPEPGLCGLCQCA
jgi:hypothetical protein